MAKIIFKCPWCYTINEVKNNKINRLSMRTDVVCKNCYLQFRVILTHQDVEALFEAGSDSPIVKGDKDVLKSKYYRNV